MPRTIQCDHCGVVLNLPNVPPGKRLKCPKCGAKFQVKTDDLLKKSAEMPSAHDASPDSSQEIRRGHGDFDLPTAAGDLRDTFDLPLLSSSDAAPAKAKKPAQQTSDALALFENDAAPAKAKKPAQQTGDALALFEEDKPKPKRTTGAEARKQARRCPTCGGSVPQGMSICSTCGLDLETGTRVALDDDLMPEAPPKGPSLPIIALAVGAICFLGSLFMTVACLMPPSREAGWKYFVPVCLFATFGSVQLLRGKSAKLLLMALTFGAVVDVVALIAMPIVEANTQVVAEQLDSPTPDGEDMQIRSFGERLDTSKMTTGIVLLVVYAGAAAYLVSAPVRRHFSTL